MSAILRRFSRRLAIACWIPAATSAVLAQAPPQASPSGAAPANSDRLVIATLANDSNPDDLDFQGAECTVDAGQRAMTCAFQQVFLSVAPFDAQVCLATTNSFERRFEKTTATTWVSREGPDGPCGIVDTATLINDEGEVQWTLEYRKTVTRRESASCRGEDPAPERYSWRHARRRLPCQFVQPGAVR